MDLKKRVSFIWNIPLERKDSFSLMIYLFARSGMGNICPVDQIDQHPLAHPVPVAASGHSAKSSKIAEYL